MSDHHHGLAIEPGQTFRLTVENSGVLLVPARENSGFTRRGKALVFGAPDGEVLRSETVEEVLSETRSGYALRMAGLKSGGKRSR